MTGGFRATASRKVLGTEAFARSCCLPSALSRRSSTSLHTHQYGKQHQTSENVTETTEAEPWCDHWRPFASFAVASPALPAHAQNTREAECLVSPDTSCSVTDDSMSSRPSLRIFAWILVTRQCACKKLKICRTVHHLQSSSTPTAAGVLRSGHEHLPQWHPLCFRAASARHMLLIIQ